MRVSPFRLLEAKKANVTDASNLADADNDFHNFVSLPKPIRKTQI